MRIEALRHSGIAPGMMSWQIILAVVLSIFTSVLIFALNHMEDAALGVLMDSIVTALSLLVGFSWRRLLEVAVRHACNSSSRPAFMEITLSLVVALVVVSAWRRYVLVKVERHSGMRHPHPHQQVDSKDGAGDDREALVEMDVKGDCREDMSIPLVGTGV